MPHSYAYIRVSTEGQDKDTMEAKEKAGRKINKYHRAGDSLKVQWQMAQEYRERMNLPPFGIKPYFQDIISSKQHRFMARSAVKQMLTYAQRGDHIIFQFYDRIGRSALDTLVSLEQMSRMGLFFHLSGENIRIDWSGSLNDRILCMGKAMAAEIDNFHRGERRRLAHRHQQTLGKWHNNDLRFGLRWVDEEKKLFEEHPIEQQVIATIQEFYLRGMGARRMASVLKECRVGTRYWDYKSVRELLGEALQDREPLKPPLLAPAVEEFRQRCRKFHHRMASVNRGS